MKRDQIVTCFFIGLFIFILHCSKYKENPVGSEYLQRDNLGLEKVTLFQSAPTDTFYQTSISTSGSSYLYVGEYHGTRSQSLMQFSMTDFSDTVTVDSAIVTLYVNTILGSSQIPFIPTVHQITASWEESDISWEDMESGSIIGNAIPFTETFANSDSVIFTLPPSLIKSWIDTTDQIENYGILLTYTTLDTGSIIQYHSANTTEGTPPILTLFYTENSIKNISDITPVKDAHVSAMQQEPRSDRLFIANSIAFRSLLFFDIDIIPANATINRALLTLHADTSLSYPDNSSLFYLSAYPVTDPSWPIPLVPYDSSTYAEEILEEDSIRINVTSIVEGWIYEFIENAGLVLKGIYEDENLQQRGFYSTSADSALHPSLEIMYSTPPSSRM
ncbi:DNRLRE domain-containing protein [bacterium]|nr:DNRLRE domain-containing protein [bacterium]